MLYPSLSLLEMSRSKSVARSVRTSSGAKSAAREEYKYLLLSTRLIWQILSLSVAQFNLHFNSPGGSCSYPISCYEIKIFPRLFALCEEDY